MDLIRRANTIKLSRPGVWPGMVESGDEIDVIANGCWYILGDVPPHYPVPAIPQIHQWNFSLWCALENMPTLSDDEWEREENEWQDYLDGLE